MVYLKLKFKNTKTKWSQVSFSMIDNESFEFLGNFIQKTLKYKAMYDQR